MPKILKKPKAEEDLLKIWEYIAEDSPKRADQFLDKLGNTLKMLAQFPEIGRSREELRQGVRSFAQAPYVIFYKNLKNGIEVLRVLHGARDIAVLL